MNFENEFNEFELKKAAKEFEETEKEILEMESQGNSIVVPKTLDEKMLQMIREFEILALQKNKKKRSKRVLRLAAMIMICITATFAVITTNVDAFRIKFFDIIGIDHGEYMDINIVEKGNVSPEVKEKFPEEWDNVFYPMSLPEGYELIEADSLGSLKGLTFSMKEKEDIYISLDYTPIGEWNQSIDSENAVVGKTKVNNKDALYTSKEGRNILVWADNGYEFTLITYDITIEKAVEVADSIAYVNLQ
ncbi:DUF4367 domain-containing protein [Clostridium aminobutyricum]|uniref:DUF4367 domain-containing protein n=1 Tax=Clostridium aminobutyricum TaxID=33953 RepID=A0A939IJ82_CLOAM|nr:DUF4367 domain-containing protein [Clostridium aminobutyricum]MBN7773338.1 DUF4367 domain-containing protein [Clostridium aminobutyricum]